METLPNLYSAGFYSRLGNSSKEKIYMVKVVRSRQRIEVTTRSDTRPREERCDKRHDAETEKKLERRILS